MPRFVFALLLLFLSQSLMGEPLPRTPVNNVTLTGFFTTIKDHQRYSDGLPQELELLRLFGPTEDYEKLFAFYRKIEYRVKSRSFPPGTDFSQILVETRKDIIFRVVILYTVEYSRRIPVLSFIAPFVTKYGEPKSTRDRQWLTYDWKDTATSLRIDIESAGADATSVKSYRATYDDLAMTRALEGEKRNLRLHDSSYGPQQP